MAYRVTSHQEIAHDTPTEVEMNGEIHDITGHHSNTSNPGRITIPVGWDGYYRIFAQIKWEADAGAAGSRALYIKLNGEAAAIGETTEDATNLNMVQNVVTTKYLNAGDYVTADAYQSSGGALDVQYGNNACNTFLGIDYLGA